MLNAVDLSSVKPSPEGQIHREWIWSRRVRQQGSGQDSPEKVGWERGNKHREKTILIPSSLPSPSGRRGLYS